MNSIQLIRNATIVNEGKSFVGSVVIDGKHIRTVYSDNQTIEISEPYTEIDATG